MLIICAVIGLYGYCRTEAVHQTLSSTALASLPICSKCPAAGHWSRWEDYTSCTGTCGLFGRKVQKRRCLSWKWGCPCKGPYSRTRRCAPKPCPDDSNACAEGYSLYHNYKLKKVLCGNVTLPSDYVMPKCRITKVLANCAFPNLGIWSGWKSTAPCTATCGLNGMVTQNRTCLSESKGHKCTGSSTRTIHCPKLVCPGDVCALDTKATTTKKATTKATTKTTKKPTTTTTTKKTTTSTTTTTTTTTTPALPCVTTSVPTTTYADCAAVGGGFIDVGGSCYQAIFINDSYAGGARAKCQALNPNADLGTIRCDSENTGVANLVPAALKTQCLSFGNFFYSQLLLGINNVTTTSGIAWSNGANSTYRNWAPGEPNGNSPAETDAASSATLYISSTDPAGGATYPLGQWENMLPSWVVCAAVCEVITAKTGNGCGFSPCQTLP